MRLLWLFVAMTGLAAPSVASATPTPANAFSDPGTPWLVLGAGAEGGTRSFTHHEPTTGETRTYQGKGFSGYALSAELRPLVLSSRVSFVVTADFWQAILLSSWSHRENGDVGTSSIRFDTQARARLRTGRSPKSAVLGLGGGFGRWTFDIDVPPSPDLETPNGNYSFVRGGIDLRVPVRAFTLLADASALSVFDTAPLGNRTAAGRPIGADFTLGASYSPWRRVAARVLAEYTRFRFDLAPLAGLSELPARVTDEYFTVAATVTVRF